LGYIVNVFPFRSTSALTASTLALGASSYQQRAATAPAFALVCRDEPRLLFGLREPNDPLRAAGDLFSLSSS